MTRPARLGAALDALRLLLHPGPAAARRDLGPPSRWAGLMLRWRDDPRCGRAVPVAADRLRRAGLLDGLPSEDRVLAQAARAWGEARARSTAAALARVARAAAEADASPTVVKGPALHGWVYDDPATRPSGDVDLLIDAADAARFDRALRASGCGAGPGTDERLAAHARCGDPTLVDLSYETPEGVPLEVKVDPTGLGAPPVRIADLARAGPPSGVYRGLRRLEPDALVLQQACAIARRDGWDLLAHAELAEVLVRLGSEADPDRALGLVEGEGIDGILRPVFERTEALFPGTVPLGWRRRGRRGGVTPSALRRALGAPGRPPHAAAAATWLAQGVSGRRPAAFVRWLWRRAFPPQPLRAWLANPSTGGSPALRTLRRVM